MENLVDILCAFGLQCAAFFLGGELKSLNERFSQFEINVDGFTELETLDALGDDRIEMLRMMDFLLTKGVHFKVCNIGFDSRTFSTEAVGSFLILIRNFMTPPNGTTERLMLIESILDEDGSLSVDRIPALREALRYYRPAELVPILGVTRQWLSKFMARHGIGLQGQIIATRPYPTQKRKL